MYSEQAALRALTFIQNFKQSKGDWAGCKLRLMDWQAERIVKPLFGTLRPDGKRQYRTAYIEIPRKNGKTELTSAIGNYLLLADGEGGAEIYAAAAEKGQAPLLFTESKNMIEQEPDLINRVQIIDSVKRIIYPKTRSFYQALSAEAYSKHGLNAHGILFDELHAQPDRELWDVLTTSQGSRSQPLVITITTAGVDRNSICWEQHDYALKVLNGIVNDPTFLPVIYAADEKDDWTSEDVWHKANPALGVFRHIDEMRDKCRKAQETPALEMTFRQLYLNQWVNSVQRWLPMPAWDECGAPVGLQKGKACYAGLDLSSTTDLTALCLVFPDGEGAFDILVRFWIPEDTIHEAAKRDRVNYPSWKQQGFVHTTPGNVIDYHFIQAELEELAKIYNIREIAFDRWGASKLSQDLTDAGFVMVPFGQGFASMAAPTRELMNLTLGKKLRHGGHPVLRWNADNLVVQKDPAGNLKPDKSKSTQKIDGMVALIMALDRAIRHQGEDQPSIYETRGLL